MNCSLTNIFNILILHDRTVRFCFDVKWTYSHICVLRANAVYFFTECKYFYKKNVYLFALP